MSWWLAENQPGNYKDGEWSVRTSYSSHLWYDCLELYSERYQERVAECAKRSWEGGPYAMGERGSSGRAGTPGQTKSWALNIQIYSHEILIQRPLAWQLRSILTRGGMIRLHRRCLNGR